MKRQIQGSSMTENLGERRRCWGKETRKKRGKKRTNDGRVYREEGKRWENSSGVGPGGKVKEKTDPRLTLKTRSEEGGGEGGRGGARDKGSDHFTPMTVPSLSSSLSPEY